MKYAFDEHAVSFTLLLGSSQILLLKKVRESLAGRVALYELWPLLMSELARVPDKEEATFPLIGRILSSENLEATMRDLPQTLFDDEAERLRSAEAFLLTWGGMPALLDLSAEERRKWLRDYEYTYLERDLGDLARLDDLGPFRKFQKLAALCSARLLNYSELARDAGVSVDTARRYLEYLRLSYQVILLQPFARNLTSQVIKAPKLYWLDVGLMRQLSGIRGEHAGEVYETMVVSELYKWINTTQHSAEMFFYRSRSGMEVDLMLKTDFGYLAIEIKGRQRLASKDVRAMKAVANALGDEWLGGLVVYNGDDVLRVSEPSIWAVPSYRLLT